MVRYDLGMTLLPCPHARYHWTLCPHCNGTNDIKPSQLEIEAPKWSYEIVESDKESPPAETVITIDI